jgi:hypothetical protein
VLYQEFLDNIEPDEHPYHRGDPLACLRDAIAEFEGLPRGALST